MQPSNYDVVVVGAGAAGLTAAIGLARAGFKVAALEAAVFPGAENWSGCVYFCENLAHADILGPEGVEELAWERRLVERGFFASDGFSILGMKYRDPAAFRYCYTVLRPIFDHHLAQEAIRLGVALLASTTVESLIREDGRIIGVCTNRGPLYSDLVFLAEGDASQLVTREGYERFADQREAPKFLQGIKQVIELPEDAIEEIFGVGPEEGIAYEILLRNCTLAGRSIRLNMGGFVYANRQSLSIGLVLPVDNLREQFAGDPNLLMEWFVNLPVLKPWLRDGNPGAFGAKIIRGGGAKDIPLLVDDGLAIGGAASAIGIDFPYPNFTGPATAMGLLLTQAVRTIRAAGGAFTRDNLRRYYLEPLQRTHYWQDVQFLRRWPGYVKRTQVFFGRNIDLALGTAYIWTRPKRWLVTKWINWLRLLLHFAGPGHWQQTRADVRHLFRALRVREVVSRPTLGRLLLDGTINALRDIAGSPRANLPSAGTMKLHFAVADENDPTGLPPARWRRWFNRFAPVLASTARRIYNNNDVPLADKLPQASQLLLRQINIVDFVAACCLALATLISGVLSLGWIRFTQARWQRRPGRLPRGLYLRYASSARRTTDFSLVAASADKHWDGRLASLTYRSAKTSHIRVLWPQLLQQRNAVVEKGLWHVCPARVYEARVTAPGQTQIIVNFENCIKCETCWRSSDLVDWGRDGQHRFTYPVSSPMLARLMSSVHAAGLSRPALPQLTDRWEPFVAALSKDPPSRLLQLGREAPDRNVPSLDGHHSSEIRELRTLVSQLEGKLEEFDIALGREPRTVDRARAEYLEMLARYAQQLSLRICDVVRDCTWAKSAQESLAELHQRLLAVVTALLERAEIRARRTWDQRFSWAAADGRQIQQHHLVGLRRYLDILGTYFPESSPPEEPVRQWLRAETDSALVAEQLATWSRRLDEAFPPTAWKEIDRRIALTDTQDGILRELIAQIPIIDAADLTHTLHPPLRKALLAELGKRDPSLAYRVASHLWARDLARLSSAPSFTEAADRWEAGAEWACFVPLAAFRMPESGHRGEALFLPATQAQTLLLLVADQLAVVPTSAPGLRIEPLTTLGLRGAHLARIEVEFSSGQSAVAADSDRIRRIWEVLSAADLTSIAAGMADQLCQRSISHATTRVQFPGLFHDEQARDAIIKFGAIKKMLAQMAARRYLIETLDHCLSPGDFSNASLERAGLVKAITSEALGTAPGSLAYNAGQIFGGTGYSEDDILAKFYRDAAAWRFLGPPNKQIYAQHGEQFLRSWHPDGRRLANVGFEGELFDEVAQRKALQAELDEIRVLRSRLRSVINEWQNLRREHATAVVRQTAGGHYLDSAALSEISELAGRQDAYLLADKALLLRTHARLEHNFDSETETSLVRVWLQEAAEELEMFECAVNERLEITNNADNDRPMVDPMAGAPIDSYADYLNSDTSYESGDFLAHCTELNEPRLVPEMVDIDPDLASRNSAIQELFRSRFAEPRAGGLSYERYLEQQHRPDAADLDFCRRNGFFRMPIPRELGGEGGSKIDYSLLIINAQRRADFALALTIQANTSIGTTPLSLARDNDLPRAQRELEDFLANPALSRDIQSALLRLIRIAGSGNNRRLDVFAKDFAQRLAEVVRARVVLRNLTREFLQVWDRAERARKGQDLAVVQECLQEAHDLWKLFADRAEEMRGELARRRAACDLYLRWIASGQISAFALTEPSAGSDTARVATRARRRSVPVDVAPDGVLTFVPAGETDTRYLLDASRLDFRDDAVYYRWSEEAEAAIIRFDEYDYETDDPSRTRYYEHGTRRVHFTDIAQLRERDGDIWYDYWELTGSKMWITNGRIAGVFALYAKTDEGVTGFIVDRHAEGLHVGKDEAKMGQLGSPTNEITLQAVRVPWENVLGLEGRGQVNALETLNVGRTGLAVTSMAQMAGLIEQSESFARAALGHVPDWAAWRLERMEEDRFIAESVTYELIGLFEHTKTRSVRLESAIAKLLATELLHRSIELAEDIYGLEGQTALHLIEKRKRDARILNIYEGTNEIQRFFILKDLTTEVAPRWIGAPPRPLPSYMGPEALQLEALKGELRQRVTSALQLFGDDLWQNPNLQANCFLIAEAVAWTKAADSTLRRLAWLDRRAQADDSAASGTRNKVGARAFERCGAEIRRRLRRFDEELIHLRRGYYAPDIRAASLLCDRPENDGHLTKKASPVTRPLSVLVVVEPAPFMGPRPNVVAGRLLEPYFTLTDADRSVLETALEIRDQARAPVHIQVVAAGPRAYGQVLREALSLGADRARLVVSEAEAVTPDSAAAALTLVLGEGPAFDLVLLPASNADTPDGLLGGLVAYGLGMEPTGVATSLTVGSGGGATQLMLGLASGDERNCELPAAVAIEKGPALRPFTIDGFLAGLSRSVELEKWPKRVPCRPLFFSRVAPGESVAELEMQTHESYSPEGVAQELLNQIGRSTSRQGEVSSFVGPIADTSGPSLSESPVIAIIGTDSTGSLRAGASATVQAAVRIGAFEEAEVAVLLLVPSDERVQRRALAQLLPSVECSVLLLWVRPAASSVELDSRLLTEYWTNLGAKPRFVVGETWTEAALMHLSHAGEPAGTAAFRVKAVNLGEDQIVLDFNLPGGKASAHQVISYEPDCIWWMTLAESAAISGEKRMHADVSPRIERWSPHLDRFYSRYDVRQLLDDLKREVKLVRLADADFVIDVGFGVGSRDGYEAVIEPLEQALRRLGVQKLVVGGSRKVTEELRLVPPRCQIGQSGERVNPRILLAIGVSGAPQHLDYIGEKATILAFNRDPEAPIMTLNQRRSKPRVYSVIGNLFETVPAFIHALQEGEQETADNPQMKQRSAL
jgi:electron transfer flavoprotein-quinone oxidoreductase